MKKTIGIINEPNPRGKRTPPQKEPIGFPGNDTPDFGDIVSGGTIPEAEFRCTHCGSTDVYLVGEFLICRKCGQTEKLE